MHKHVALLRISSLNFTSASNPISWPQADHWWAYLGRVFDPSHAGQVQGLQAQLIIRYTNRGTSLQQLLGQLCRAATQGCTAQQENRPLARRLIRQGTQGMWRARSP